MSSIHHHHQQLSILHPSLFIEEEHAEEEEEEEEEDHHQIMAAGFISFPNSSSSTINNPQSTHLLKPSDDDQLTPADETLITSSHLLSLHNNRSSLAHLWAWGELNESCSLGNSRRSSLLAGMVPSSGGHGHGQLGVSGVKMKKMSKLRKKVREPRFSFKTLSDVDVLDDGYKWRKYGQKVVKNTHHPRSYYRCTQDNCRVKKRVERLAEDPRMVITTYEGRHAHSPSQDNMEDSQANHLNNDFFW